MIAGQNSSFNKIWMDFTARRYDTFSETFEINYIDEFERKATLDLTGAFAQMHIKKKKGDGEPILVMDCAISGNELTISKNHLEMDLPKGRYWHDIEIKDADSTHITWIEGRFIIVEHVTVYLDEIIQKIKPVFSTMLSIVTAPKLPFSLSFNQLYKIITHFKFIGRVVFGNVVAEYNLLFQLAKGGVLFKNKISFQDSEKIKYGSIWRSQLAVVTTITRKMTVGFSNKIIIQSKSS
jgi:hypothetical protein